MAGGWKARRHDLKFSSLLYRKSIFSCRNLSLSKKVKQNKDNNDKAAGLYFYQRRYAKRKRAQMVVEGFVLHLISINSKGQGHAYRKDLRGHPGRRAWDPIILLLLFLLLFCILLFACLFVLRR